MIVELTRNVHWIGVVDWGIRHFHGHELSTHRGTTYNSYLVADEKIAVVDTVWGPHSREFLANLRAVAAPEKIDYVVVNHAEPDHSGALPELMRLCPNATVVVSKRGAESVPAHYRESWNFRPVQTGERISLGKNSLVFIEAPMLHWPDSMFTYLTGHNLLMSNDAFGQHYATGFRFNDQVDQTELYEEALKYYANILTPFSDLVAKKAAELKSLNLPVEMILPSHGALWRSKPEQIVAKYLEWSAQKPARSAVVLYDTMWEATRRMAEAVAEGLLEKGAGCKLFYAPAVDRNDLIVEIFKAGALVIGSPTINRGFMPTIAPALEDVRGLRFKNKVGAAFGAYGWSGEAVKLLESALAASHIPIVAESVKAKWSPGPEELERCRELGRKTADALPAN